MTHVAGIILVILDGEIFQFETLLTVDVVKVVRAKELHKQQTFSLWCWDGRAHETARLTDGIEVVAAIADGHLEHLFKVSPCVSVIPCRCVAGLTHAETHIHVAYTEVVILVGGLLIDFCASVGLTVHGDIAVGIDMVIDRGELCIRLHGSRARIIGLFDSHHLHRVAGLFAY